MGVHKRRCSAESLSAHTREKLSETWVMVDELYGAIFYFCLFFMLFFCLFKQAPYLLHLFSRNSRLFLWINKCQPSFHLHGGEQLMTEFSHLGEVFLLKAI